MSPRVLVIDDEETTRDSCTQILSREGYAVITANGAESGLVLARSESPDVVIVDLKMPGMGGEEFLRLAVESDPSLILVVMTGYATVESAVGAMKRGAYDFLPKPFTPDELRIVTRRAVEKRQLVLRAAALEREKRLMEENFVAVVAHQLRSPLASLRQQLELILKGYTSEPSEQASRLVQGACSKADALMRLLNRWLVMSRVGADAFEERAETLNLAGVLEHAVETARQEPGADALRIDLEPPAGMAEVTGDPEILPELFFNLLSNAVKYTPPGGSIRVRAACGESEVSVSVEDTGIGIGEQDLPLVFEPFYRGKRTRDSSSCGLGLAVAKRVAEWHGGRIEVRSVPGRGTCFSVFLPRASSECAKVAGLSGRAR